MLFHVITVCALFWSFGAVRTFGQEPVSDSKAEPFIKKAQEFYRKGQADEAIATLNHAATLYPGNPRVLYVRARIHEERGSKDKALEDLNKTILLDAKSVEPYMRRADLRLTGGFFTDAVRDYDKIIELEPRQAPYLWQRGIALYYAAQFAKGAAQFESHQKVNSNDVENAFWHFLCVTKDKNIEEARKRVIKIEGDARPPLMEVQKMLQGDLALEAFAKKYVQSDEAKAGNPQSLFYAAYYAGLFADISAKPELAREMIAVAVSKAAYGGYMGELARMQGKLYAAKASTK